MTSESDRAEVVPLRRTSSYRPTAFRAEPVEVTWSVQAVDANSEDGRHLQAVQGEAVRKVVTWLVRSLLRSERETS
jgi:hypothetical protein